MIKKIKKIYLICHTLFSFELLCLKEYKLKKIILFFIFFFITTIVALSFFSSLVTYNYAYHIEKIQDLLIATSSIFGTLLALYWASVSSIYSSRYLNISEQIQEIYLSLVYSKEVSFITLIYIIFSLTTYMGLVFWIIPTNYFFYVINIWYTMSILLFIFYTYVAILIFQYANISNIYNKISVQIIYNLILHDKFEKSLVTSEKIIERLRQLQLIVEYYIKNTSIGNDVLYKFLMYNVFLLSQYLAIKKNIYWNSDWFVEKISLKRFHLNFLQDSQSGRTKDLIFFEKILFKNIRLIIICFLKNKDYENVIRFFTIINNEILYYKNKKKIFFGNSDITFEYNQLEVFQDLFYFIYSLLNKTKEFNDENYFSLIIQLNNYLLLILSNYKKLILEGFNKNELPFKKNLTIKEYLLLNPYYNNKLYGQIFLSHFDKMQDNARNPLLEQELFYAKIYNLSRILLLIRKTLVLFQNKLTEHNETSLLPILYLYYIRSLMVILKDNKKIENKISSSKFFKRQFYLLKKYNKKMLGLENYFRKNHLQLLKIIVKNFRMGMYSAHPEVCDAIFNEMIRLIYVSITNTKICLFKKIINDFLYITLEYLNFISSDLIPLIGYKYQYDAYKNYLFPFVKLTCVYGYALKIKDNDFKMILQDSIDAFEKSYPSHIIFFIDLVEELNKIIEKQIYEFYEKSYIEKVERTINKRGIFFEGYDFFEKVKNEFVKKYKNNVINKG